MILVTGAAGFVGRAVVARLAASGVSVHGLVLPGQVPPVADPRIEWHAGDITRRDTLNSAFGGIATVVHLAAVVANPDEAVNEAINAEGTRTLVQLCRVHGVGRFVFMSAAAAKFRSPNAYGRSKRRAEMIVADSGLEYAIVRTPLIVGRGGEEWDRFVDYVNKIPGLVPVFGDGKAIKRPVAIGDVVDALARIVARNPLGNRIWEIAGREALSLDGLIDAVLATQGKRKIKIHIPLAVSLALGGLAQLILGSRAPLTRDIVLGLNENVDFAIGKDIETLNLVPEAMAQAISESLD